MKIRVTHKNTEVEIIETDDNKIIYSKDHIILLIKEITAQILKLVNDPPLE